MIIKFEFVILTKLNQEVFKELLTWKVPNE